jgi:hypothetical protein
MNRSWSLSFAHSIISKVKNTLFKINLPRTKLIWAGHIHKGKKDRSLLTNVFEAIFYVDPNTEIGL